MKDTPLLCVSLMKKILGSMPDSERISRKSGRNSRVNLGLLGTPQRDVYKVLRAKVGPGVAFLFMLSFEEKATDDQCYNRRGHEREDLTVT